MCKVSFYKLPNVRFQSAFLTSDSSSESRRRGTLSQKPHKTLQNGIEKSNTNTKLGFYSFPRDQTPRVSAHFSLEELHFSHSPPPSSRLSFPSETTVRTCTDPTLRVFQISLSKNYSSSSLSFLSISVFTSISHLIDGWKKMYGSEEYDPVEEEEITQEDAWAVISAYFEEKGLVRQQLDSFDEFIQNTMQEIVDESAHIEIRPESQHNPGRQSDFAEV